MSNPNLISWPAPAKLNLFLHITGRRADGFHLLQTVFQILDYGDELTFAVTDEGSIVREYELAGVSENQDLIVRAARLLQNETSSGLGARIRLHKRLPAGGGLGGGSSDAATTLVALNHLWGTGLETEQLVRLGLALGADVPIFIRGFSAWAEGVGERLQTVDLPENWFLVLIPPVNVSTAKVFTDPQLIRDCPPITIRDFLTGQGDNVCEPIVRANHPEVEAAFGALGQYAPARMTGTGACVFARFEDEASARTAWELLAGQWQGFIAKGVNTSPLHETLRQCANQGK